QIQRAYQLSVQRDPVAAERRIAEAFLRRQTTAFAGQGTRLTFRPDVAQALSKDYFEQLRPSQFLVGPSPGWSYHRGFWAPPYEGIRVGSPAGPVRPVAGNQCE